MFVGYDLRKKGWKFFDPITGIISISRDAVFNEMGNFVKAEYSSNQDLKTSNDVATNATTLRDYAYIQPENEIAYDNYATASMGSLESEDENHINNFSDSDDEEKDLIAP